jgi:hypothetical protein
MSEDEEPVPETVQHHAPSHFSDAENEAQPSAAVTHSFEQSFSESDREPISAPARPKFAEMDEDTAYTPLPRDYASDMGNGLHASEPFDEHHTQPVAALFADSASDQERDLDVPAFMRRLQF